MKKYKLHIKIATVIVFIVIATIIIFNNNQNKKTWIAYFCSSSTDVMYDKGQAQLIEFNSKGKIINSYNAIAYPFSGLVNFNNELLFQTKIGVSKVNDDIEKIDINIPDNTIGYNMAGNLNKDTYYFLCNGTYKDGYYSSTLILGNKTNAKNHELKGFINSYGNDENSIYILTDDMTTSDNKKIQKISVDDTDNISTESANIPYTVESNFKMIVTKDYIYAFVINHENKISVLKISKDSLEIKETIDLLTFNYEVSGDSYYPISTNSIFLKDNKIYYPSTCGKVYSFNIDNNEFLEEFTFEDYSMTSALNSICCYDGDEKEISILYLNSLDKNYYLNCYDTMGNLKDKIKLKLPDNLNNKLYPHNFLKLSKGSI